jgi:hypothetical protein
MDIFIVINCLAKKHIKVKFYKKIYIRFKFDLHEMKVKNL